MCEAQCGPPKAWKSEWWLWEPGAGMRPRGKTSLLNRTRSGNFPGSKSTDELYTAEGFDCAGNVLFK